MTKLVVLMSVMSAALTSIGVHLLVNKRFRALWDSLDGLRTAVHGAIDNDGKAINKLIDGQALLHKRLGEAALDAHNLRGSILAMNERIEANQRAMQRISEYSARAHEIAVDTQARMDGHALGGVPVKPGEVTSGGHKSSEG